MNDKPPVWFDWNSRGWNYCIVWQSGWKTSGYGYTTKKMAQEMHDMQSACANGERLN